MKVRSREIAKPGIYGTVDNPVVVTEGELREIAETFPSIKKAPVSLHGHWLDPARPRLANVVSVSWDEATKTLSGEIEEHDVLAAAVDAGFYPDVSVGGKRRAVDGKMYLHHLAYLGEEPPAVKDLVAGITRNLETPTDDTIAAADGDADTMIPPISARLLTLSDPNKIAPPAGRAKPKEARMKTLEELQEELLRSQTENERLTKTLGDLSKKYPDAGIQLSDAEDPRITVLMQQLRESRKAELLRAAAGRVPKAKEGIVLALADSFHVNATVELADGEKKVMKTQADALGELLASLPPPVAQGKLDLSDPSDPSDGSAPLDLSKIKCKF